MEVLTYQQTITAAIALIAIILSSVSLRRTTRVQEQQLRLQRKQEELTDLQLEALRKQSETPGSTTKPEPRLPKADVRVELSRFGKDFKFIITNWGNGTAKDVQFELEIESGKPTPLVKGDYEQKIPIPELAPGNRIPLWAAITMGMGTTFSGRWTWRNPDGSTETRKSSLAI